MPDGSIVCAYCGVTLSPYARTSGTGTMTCARCGKFMPIRGKMEGKTLCLECEQQHMRDLAAAHDQEERRKAMVVSQVIARHPELRPMIMRRLGLTGFEGRFYVDYGTYREICQWDSCITDAKNYELARRYEDAARKYESIGMWREAGLVREKMSGTTVKHVTINLNDLIDKLRVGGLSVPVKCTACGATITIGKDTSPESLKFCSYCGAAMNVEMLANVLRDALR
jgi:hypothetical protein